jgi:transketolase
MCIEPFDKKTVLKFAGRFARLIIFESCARNALRGRHVETKIGRDDISFFECGSQEYLEAKYGVDLPRFIRAVVEGK